MASRLGSGMWGRGALTTILSCAALHPTPLHSLPPHSALAHFFQQLTFTFQGFFKCLLVSGVHVSLQFKVAFSSD